MNRNTDEDAYERVENAYLRGLTEINKLKHQIRDIKRQLSEIRNDSKWWKPGKISGADQYQGLPPFLRIIDHILGED